MAEPEAPLVAREEIEVICRVIDIILGVPGGVMDHINDLTAAGKTDLEAFAAYRRMGPAMFQKADGR